MTMPTSCAENLAKAAEAITTHLEDYRDSEKGRDHDRYVQALIRIGRELGYTPDRERRVNAHRVDLVWIDAGCVHAAIEVEISGRLKKNLISTWEFEPRLAIIVIDAKHNNGIADLERSVLLKSLPHPLLVVNVTTRDAFGYGKGERVREWHVQSVGDERRDKPLLLSGQTDVPPA